MTDIKLMSHDDLIEHTEELQQTIDGHNDELQGREEDGYNKAMLEMEGKIEHAFSAGYNDKYVIGTLIDNDLELTKAYLNYKMEQRL